MSKLAFFFLCFLSTSLSALYIPDTSLKLSKSDEKILEKIEKNLNEIKTLKADIHQEVETRKGSKVTQKGTLFLQRLPKNFGLKLIYAKPHEMTIIARGSSVMYEDVNNAQKGFLDLKSTHAAFLMHPRISFQKNFRVIGFSQKKGKVNVKVVQKDNPAAYLDLSFSEKTYNLVGWTIYEPQGNTIDVELKNIDMQAKFDKNTFKFWSPKTGIKLNR